MRKNYYVKVLTQNNSLGVEEKVKDAIEVSLMPYELEFQPMQAYCECKGWGEMDVLVKDVKDVDKDKLMRRLANKWHSEVANNSWARIYCDKIQAISFTEAA